MASYHLSIKSGKRGKAAKHAAYIAREGKHGRADKKEDLIATEHGNLPDWAYGNPSLLWKMADQNERKNGAAYRELEVALPAELAPDQQVALLQAFVNAELPGKPYQLAIHEPIAALGGVKQPHAHIMFSDRKPDGIERTPSQYFKRHNPTNPERGGCKKDSGGKAPEELKNELISRRERWANLQNEFLEANGHPASVDHRSNKDRGIQATAERHLGHVGIKKMTPEERSGYQSKRRSA
ncbi:MobA/MobL family protein [Azonexus sp. IMCC34842]|uniref:MobA/MobL family protein n=1 Tax=Azonexus sp. IMCC34842 TaxID=3420950 RepID=UPI003D0DF79F